MLVYRGGILSTPHDPSPQPTVPQQPYAPQQVPVQQGFPQQGFPAPQQAHTQRPAYQQPAQVQRPAFASQVTTLGGTNTYAVLAIILAFIAPLAGIIFGHLGLNQIKRNGDAGRGIALTGLVLGYAYFVSIALFLFAYAFFIFAIIGSMGAAFSDYSTY